MGLKRNLTDTDVRIIRTIVAEQVQGVVRRECEFLYHVIDDRMKSLHRSLGATVATMQEGIEHMDDLVRRATEVAERSNTVAASFEAWWNEVKGRLDQAVSQNDINAIRQALDTIDANSTKFGQAIAANTPGAPNP